jgi:hypothetical protein
LRSSNRGALTQPKHQKLLSNCTSQANRAFEILEGKLYRGKEEQVKPFVFPIKAKSPEAGLEAQTPVG